MVGAVACPPSPLQVQGMQGVGAAALFQGTIQPQGNLAQGHTPNGWLMRGYRGLAPLGTTPRATPARAPVGSAKAYTATASKFNISLRPILCTWGTPRSNPPTIPVGTS